jgi:hypothetical protein
MRALESHGRRFSDRFKAPVIWCKCLLAQKLLAKDGQTVRSRCSNCTRHSEFVLKRVLLSARMPVQTSENRKLKVECRAPSHRIFRIGREIYREKSGVRCGDPYEAFRGKLEPRRCYFETPILDSMFPSNARIPPGRLLLAGDPARERCQLVAIAAGDILICFGLDQ